MVHILSANGPDELPGVIGIYGKHVSPYQALGIACHEHLSKQWLDQLTHGADKFGDVCMAGVAVAAAGDELHVVQAGSLYGATGDRPRAGVFYSLNAQVNRQKCEAFLSVLNRQLCLWLQGGDGQLAQLARVD